MVLSGQPGELEKDHCDHVQSLCKACAKLVQTDVQRFAPKGKRD